MKRVLLFITALLPLAALAQDAYESLLSGNKIWTVRNTPSTPPEHGGQVSYTEVRLEGDTIINGVLFRKQFERTRLENEDEPAAWQDAAEYVGQDGGKVYLYSKPHDESILVMDFGLQPGDVYRQTGYQGETTGRDFTVTAVSDTILEGSTDRVARKCLYLQDALSPHSAEVWIEGIGSMTDGTHGLYGSLLDGVSHRLVKCTDGDECIFPIPEDLKTGIRQPSTSLSDKQPVSPTDEWYDLQGRRIAGVPASGVYIQDGRKYVVGK